MTVGKDVRKVQNFPSLAKLIPGDYLKTVRNKRRVDSDCHGIEISRSSAAKGKEDHCAMASLCQ